MDEDGGIVYSVPEKEMIAIYRLSKQIQKPTIEWTGDSEENAKRAIARCRECGASIEILLIEYGGEHLREEGE